MSTDKNLLPSHYVAKHQPFFSGRGNLNVTQLEDLCEDFAEYVHQQLIVKEKLLDRLKIINELTIHTDNPLNDFLSKIADV